MSLLLLLIGCGGPTSPEGKDSAPPTSDCATPVTVFADSDGDSYGDPATATTTCTPDAAAVDNSDDCDDTDAAVHPGAVEVCDDEDRDEDCNGQADDDDPAVTGTMEVWTDDDGDGFGVNLAGQQCDASPGTATNSGDCDDRDADVYPSAFEYCDQVDNNCDGVIDEPSSVDAPFWYADQDGDTYGDDNNAQQSCTPIVGYVDRGGDCDDTNWYAHPGLLEACNGYDDDCDGITDPDDLPTAPMWYPDGDGDGYGDGLPVQQCEEPAGYGWTNGDCDDADPAVYPGATEVCDDTDNDCDGQTDDDDSSLTDAPLWYRDQDGDGFGANGGAIDRCEPPSGYLSVSGDCDDYDATVSPGAAEVCDDADADEDCDGLADDDDADVDTSTFGTIYTDSDGDGYGATAAFNACDAPAGYSADGGDCDETSSLISPAARERCDDADTDEDCDGLADDADESVDVATMNRYYLDADGDGYGDSLTVTLGCDLGDGRVEADGDCDEADATVNPGAVDACGDSLDSDCDGAVSCDASIAIADAFLEGQTGDFLGDLIVPIGDQDGDGTPEITIASRYSSAGGSRSGAAVVVSGTTAGRQDVYAAAMGSVTGSPNQLLGDDVATGDLDGDTIDDLVVGSIYASVSHSYDGAVYAFTGPITGSLTPADAWGNWYGDTEDSQAGVSVAIGELDGDSGLELAVGASYYSTYKGAVYLISTPSGGMVDLGSTANVIYGAGSYDYVGIDQALDDFNGDGIDDVALPLTSDNAVAVFDGPVTGSITTAMADALRSGGGPFWVGGVIETGDVNGDGLPDILASGYYSSINLSGDGQVRIFTAPFSGSSTSAAVTITGYQDSQFFGETLASGVDLDGDGAEDMLAGGDSTYTADGWPGVAFLFYGQSGWSGSFMAGEADTRLVHDDNWSYGSAVSFLDDLDGDGVPELGVGSTGSNSTTVSGGIVAIVSGGLVLGYR